MKSLKILKYFDSIPKINSYSHCGSSLEKMFKMSSLRYLIKTLKYKEEYQKKFLKEESLNMKKEYDIYEMEGMKNKKIINQEEDIFSLPITTTKTTKNNKSPGVNKTFFYHKRNYTTLNDSPDSLKYNPNYNSIMKNIPAVKIVKPSINKRRINKNNILNEKIKKEINKFIMKDIDTKNNNLHTINNNDSSKNNNFDNDNSFLGKGKRFLTQINIKNNHNKKFKSFHKNHLYKKDLSNLPSICTDCPHYMIDKKISSHKIIKDENTNNNNNTISFQNKNRAVDFEKMQSRSNKVFLNVNSLKVPNTGYYEPKYNSVHKRIININLNRPVMDKLQRKHLLLKKIMTSYNMESKFLLIDNNKLNDEALKKINL